MKENSKDTHVIELPKGSYKPIPHYHQSMSLALSLAALLRAIPNLGSVIDDMTMQVKDGGDYGEALWVLETIFDARTELEFDPPESDGISPLVEDLRASMENWGPVEATIAYLASEFPLEAGDVIGGMFANAARISDE